MKKVLATILAAILIVFSVNIYAASDNIDSIDIKATLMDDGALMVTEVWEATPGTGTEFFIPKSNMRDIVIADYKVSDENGPYETINNWNVNASFDEKARKCGINETSDGIELCFGKSDLNKDKTYTLTYTMSSAAQSFDDMDGFNIRFVNDQMDPAPKKVSFELSLEGGEITEDNARVWGFGSSADIVFEDGKVIVHEINDFSPANHLTVLFGLNKGVINPISVASGSFEELKERAMEGSDYYDRHEENIPEDADEAEDDHDYDYGGGFLNGLNRATNMIMGPLRLAFIAIVTGFASMLFSKAIKKKEGKLPEDVDYYRDLPIGGSIILNNFIYSQFHSFSVRNLVAAYFLKWIKDGNIEVINEKFKKGFIFKRDVAEDCFAIIKEPVNADSMERELFDLVERASGEDRILRNAELTRAFERGNKATYFVQKYKDISSLESEKARLSTQETRLVFYKYDKLTMKGREEAVKQKGFIKFLKDFTLINEREAVEVALWDDYLVLAALFGLGEKVLNKFKMIDPNYTYAGYSGMDPLVMYHVVNHLGTAMSHVYENHASSSSSSSGGGGGMSFGGGGGFSAGGSGGGGR